MSKDITLSIPFSKVDKTRRIVTGYATADNVDPAGDLIEYSASTEAFKNWVGNIREMHAPKAVGKAVNYRPVMVPYQGKEYRGFEVDAYISKGAEDTWQKILDGTLKGFSVGGRIVKASEDFDKSTNRTIRRIKKYELNELSLVDNMGNPAAAVTMIKRAPDGTLHYDLSKYKVFYCDRHSVARVNSSVCQHGDTMREIGDIDEIDVDVITKMVKADLKKAATGFVPPQGARSEARKGLEWRREFNRGGTEIGVARARDISNGKELSLDTINRMVSYFARHEVDKKGQGWSPGEQGYPSAGRIAWALWGGDAGKTWANSVAGRMKKNNITDDMNNEIEKEVAYGHNTPPKGFPESRSQYADPDNYKYPLDTPARVMAAFKYYNQAGQQQSGGYNDAQWKSIGSRIVAALNRTSETDYKLEGNKIVHKSVGGNMDLQKNIEDGMVDNVQALSDNEKMSVISRFIAWINGDTTKAAGDTMITPAGVTTPTMPDAAEETGEMETEETEGNAVADDIAEYIIDASTENEGPETEVNNISNSPLAPNVNIFIGHGNEMEKAKGDGGDMNSSGNNAGALECSACGAMNKAGATVCKECGAKLEKSSGMKKSDSQEESETDFTDSETDNGGNEVDLEKLMEGIGTLLDEKISKIKEEVIESVDEKLAEVTKSVDEKVETVSERVESVENAGAIRKSVEETVSEDEIIEKKAESFWGGIFLPAEIANVLGYES